MIRINYELTRQSIYEKKPIDYQQLLKLIYAKFDKNIKNINIFAFNLYKKEIYNIYNNKSLQDFYKNTEVFFELFVFDNNLISSQYESTENKQKFEIERQTLMEGDKNEIIDSYEKEIELLKNEINNKSNTIAYLNHELESSKKNISILKHKFQNEMDERKKEIKNKKKEIDKLNDKIIDKDDMINNLNSAINSSEVTLNKLKRQDLIKPIFLKNKDQRDFIPQYDDKNPLDFYDIIADINSIKEITNGWKILMNEKGKEKFQKKDETAIKIGVIGNGNKGKSFLLSKISDIPLPIGTSIKTKGLSIKFPDLEKFKNKNIILLDSAGQETPVLNNKKNNNNSFVQEELKKTTLQSKEAAEQERLAEKSRDKLFTEFFLQNYIIKYSDILILVVGILTFSEQKLINKVKRTFASLNKKSSLIIVHNLQSYVTKKQVKDYIRDTLTKSDTFDLKEDKVISNKREEIEWTYFYEPNTNTNHLIYAREESEAGDFYNRATINKIYELINSINNREPLNLSENIKDLFLYLSNDILETSIKQEDIVQEKGIIKLNLKDKNELKLKKCSIDELGLSKFSSNRFEPKFCYYIDDNKLKIICEIPGLNKDTFDCSPECQNGHFTAKIRGEKLNDLSILENKNIKKTSNREFGEFSLNIIIDNANIEENSGKLDYKDGLVTITYAIKSKSTSLRFSSNK